MQIWCRCDFEFFNRIGHLRSVGRLAQYPRKQSLVSSRRHVETESIQYRASRTNLHRLPASLPALGRADAHRRLHHRPDPRARGSSPTAARRSAHRSSPPLAGRRYATCPMPDGTVSTPTPSPHRSTNSINASPGNDDPKTLVRGRLAPGRPSPARAASPRVSGRRSGLDRRHFSTASDTRFAVDPRFVARNTLRTGVEIPIRSQ